MDNEQSNTQTPSIPEEGSESHIMEPISVITYPVEHKKDHKHSD